MVFINLVRSSPASFNARRKPWMVGDDFTLSLTVHCHLWFVRFSRGTRGGVFLTVETVECRKGLSRPKGARDLG